uniref:Major facilitator superfamily (MFS) profile domain-containing protein n=1 Tax=Anser cygnoides TaxID=8845 RepID=A0A8B9D2X8_ANSCY
MILVLGIGGSFPYGFHISVINYPSVHIRKFINETWMERHGSPLHPETIMLLWSFIVSVYGIGGDSHFTLNSRVLGLFVCFRKKCQMFTNLIMLVAALLMAFSKTAKSFEMILAGRFLYGVGTGFSLNIHPQYVGEISPKKLRGFTNSTVAVFLTLGKLTGQVVGLRAKAGTFSFDTFSSFQSTLIERFGRKVLLCGGYTLMCSVLALLTMTLSLQVTRQQPSGCLPSTSPLPAGATVSIMVEIFSQSFRPSAFLIVGCINWMGLFVLGMIFPLIVDNLGPFCFLIFLGILVLSAIFIYLYLPETKGKSIMEIKAEFNKLNFGKKEISVTENNFPKEQLFCTKL